MKTTFVYIVLSFLMCFTVLPTQAQDNNRNKAELKIQRTESKYNVVILNMAKKGNVTIYKAGGEITHSTYIGTFFTLPNLPKGHNLILIKDENGKMATITLQKD